MPPNKVTHIKRIDWNKLDLSDVVNNLADIVKIDTREGIHRGKDIDGNSFKRLADSTIRSKRKKGSSNPGKALWDEGIMKEVYVKPKATKAKPKANIQVPKGRGKAKKGRRTEVGGYHNTGDGVPKREWFGIGSRVKKKLDKEMKLRLKEHLKIGRVR